MIFLIVNQSSDSYEKAEKKTKQSLKILGVPKKIVP